MTSDLMDTAVADGTVRTAAVLDVDGLTVRYGTGATAVTAVSDVSLTVKPGERVALVGESGSGKTAVCLAVAGFLTDPSAQVTARRIAVDGADLTGRRRTRLPRRTPGIAMIFQDATTSLDPVWTIGSQLRDVIRTRHGVSRRASAGLAEEWLHKVGLRDTKRVLASRPYELSGGMRQRAMIALALSGTPRLLIADEPTSALDASLSREAMGLLVALCDEFGAGLLIVSHDIRLCQGYADRMLVMYGGRLVEQGRAATLDRDARHPYTRALLRSVPTLDSATRPLLATIPVSASGQHDPQGGCGFRPRCEQAHEACGAVPPIVQIGADGSAACWLADPSVGATGSGTGGPGLVPVAAGASPDGGK